MNSPKTAREVARILARAAENCELSLAVTFDRFLDLGTAVLLADDASFDHAKKSLLPVMQELTQAFALLMREAGEGYEDVLGQVYMINGERDQKAFRQVFSPWTVAVMMGQMSAHGLKLKSNNESSRGPSALADGGIENLLAKPNLGWH